MEHLRMHDERAKLAKKTIDFGALAPFGFTEDETGWHYAEPILDGAFTVLIRIDRDGGIFGTVRDDAFGGEYLPMRTEREVGAYVGAVREAYDAVFDRIAASCCADRPFYLEQTNRIATALKARYGDVPDRPFAKLPDYATFRVPETRKWYGLVMWLPRARITGEADADSPYVEVLNLKTDPAREPELTQIAGIYPGYHMKRPDWITLLLDGTVPDETVLSLLDVSRTFAGRGAKPKAHTGAVEWIVPGNPRYYDVDAAFAAQDEILWKQSSDIHVGDTVFLYVGAPVSAVRYRCIATAVNIPYAFRNDDVSMKSVMRIRRLQAYPPEAVPFAKLCELGIRAVRGPRTVTKAFSDYMKTL